MSEAIVPAADYSPAALNKQATEVAHVCREIVLKTSVEIDRKKYVRVEGWQSISTAHGCVAGIKLVEVLENGVRAVAELRTISNGVAIAEAEGFVGRDEVTWFGGTGQRWDQGSKKYVEKIYPKRADYAIRAMAQTRAISRVCRSAFAHVVVLMDADLSTTPAEEVPMDGFGDERHDKAEPRAKPEPRNVTPPPAAKTAAAPDEKKAPSVPRKDPVATAEEVDRFRKGAWQNVAVHFGKNNGVKLGELSNASLGWYIENYAPKGNPRTGALSDDDRILRAALDAAADELETR